jgi:hypothetical protein
MKTMLVITDLTRMYHGHVCIAGYDAQHQPIRPVNYPQGISEASAIDKGRAVLYPFAVVECDLLQPAPDPPHTEDYPFDPASLHFVRPAAEDKRQSILGWSLFPTVNDLFGQPILRDHGVYVKQGQGPRSLGTIQPKTLRKVVYQEGDDGTWGYRILFKDAQEWYDLKITDLTLNYYAAWLHGQVGQPEQVAVELTRMLKTRTVYLRIGLSRGWQKFPGCCFLQVNAIHTFPDYLEGKTFVDFLPKTP